MVHRLQDLILRANNYATEGNLKDLTKTPHLKLPAVRCAGKKVRSLYLLETQKPL